MTRMRIAGVMVLLLACQKPNSPKEEPAQPSQAAPAPAAPHAAPSSAPAPAPAPSGDAPRAGGLSWQDTEPFVRRAPKSSMRSAEYGVKGDERSELTVFYFGPDQGGSVEANISRWLGQLSQPDGSDTASKAQRSTRKVGDIEVSVLEATGNYSGGMAMPGAPAPEPIADAMMLGAIAKGPQGPVFFKLIGPRDVVERSRAGFDALIGSLHP